MTQTLYDILLVILIVRTPARRSPAGWENGCLQNKLINFIPKQPKPRENGSREVWLGGIFLRDRQ